MADDRVAGNRSCRRILLVKVLRVVEHNEFHLCQFGDWISYASFACSWCAWIHCETKLTPVVMTVEGITSEFDVLAATSRYDPCVSGNAV